MQKLYAYVDESGQDTEGKLFIVSLVIVAEEREKLADLLQTIEKVTQKGTQKWTKAKDVRRTAYILSVLSNSAFKGKLFYGIHWNTREYVQATVTTTALAIQAAATDEYKATVIVDGLHREERDRFSTSLRRQGIRTEKIRGADEEKDPFIRLADALCGFIRDVENRGEYRKVFEKAEKEGFIVTVGS